MTRSYRLTISGTNTRTGARRTFRVAVLADTADEARRSIGNNPVADPTDNARFDEWRITSTKRGAR